MEGTRAALHREEITADFSNAELVPPQHISNRLRRPIEFLGHLFDRPLHEFLSQEVEFGRGPTAVINLPLNSVLNDEPPASLLGAAGVALKPDHQLLQLVT
jgi:hypothetical protein